MTMTLSCRRATRAFTLIELLVVITIIGLLASLAFPAIAGALKAAKKAEASAMISQLKISMNAYQNEYGNWPTGIFPTEAIVDSSSANLYDLLRGKAATVAGVDQNPRLIVFMEFNAKVLRQGALNATNTKPPANSSTATAFVDPWSQPYYFQVDADYNNEITVPSDTAATTEVVNSSLGIWSRGPQKVWNDQLDPKKNYLRSWK